MRRAARGSPARLRARGNRPGVRSDACGPPIPPRAILLFRHQHREAEAVQQPLDGAFPLAFFLPHFEQFAGERQSLFAQTRARHSSRAAPTCAGECWTGPGAEMQFASSSSYRSCNWRSSTPASVSAFCASACAASAIVRLHNGPPVGEERIGVGGARHRSAWRARRSARAARPFFLLRSRSAISCLIRSMRSPPCSAIACGWCRARPSAAARFLSHRDPMRQLFQFDLQIGNSLFQQPPLSAARTTAAAHRGTRAAVPLRRQRCRGVAILHHRRQKPDLGLRLQHQFVGAVQILIVPDQRVDALLDRRRPPACARARNPSGCPPISSRRSGGTDPSPARSRCRSDAGTPSRRAGRCRRVPLAHGAQPLAQRLDV